ncbi:MULTISPECIES: DNA-processing protein DprA [Exiguobacterium]|uniref:DNA-processing protein DprA n=1 Tax=Exiguobacterium TaxID=33986 RepID=UPI002035F1FF|nr:MULTISPECIES: DNA-processing protein DprA [Exiguobacterium]MCT4778618.1 DNA-processing protein DprA [Exiguobacterium aquaticum]MCT4787987.1 DNA-processing protein DprA [Exiguobacterium mexicanum]
MNQTIARFAAERLPVEFVHHYLSHTHMNMHQFHPRVRSKAERALRSTVTYDRFLTWEDELFPSALLHIPNPPYCLFYRGDLEVLHQQTTALVGSRELNRISRRLVEHFRPLIEETVSVSGGALGIDGLVHELSLDHDRPTIAILGAGFSHLYPQVHAPLFERISRHGLLLTEYTPETPVKKFQFLERNRLVSGLANRLVVIQARHKSGTMNTVGHALEQGKTVFAVPGSPLDPLAAGPNQLIEDGAIPLTTADQILTCSRIGR